jgi:hypothetical protein
MGHNNNAETFKIMMTPVGMGMVLAFQRDCYLLGDSIYLSRHPIAALFFICTITTPTRKYQKTLEENKEKDQTKSIFC